MARIEAKAEVTGSVWKILKQAGDAFDSGDVLAILESMKMEIPVIAEDSGRVAALHVAEGASVNEGDTLMSLEVE